MKLFLPMLAVLWLWVFLLPVFGQHQNDKWYFCFGPDGLDFTNGGPTLISGSAIPSTGSTPGSACVADPVTGNLLFYTDGVTVWNALHQVMPNGSGLPSGAWAYSPAMIVPLPFSPGIYYVFTTEEIGFNLGLRLRYSVVDMSLDNGLGDIVAGQKNILLQSATSGKMTVAQTADGCGLWIVTHNFPGSTFYSWKLLKTGLSSSPVLSTTGLLLNEQHHIGGYMRASLQSDKIAQTIRDNYYGKVEIFNFDNTTGILSVPFVLNGLFSVEFSSSGRYLYSAAPPDGELIQYDLQAGSPAAIAASKTVVWPQGWQPSGVIAGGGVLYSLQRGPNGKIYGPTFVPGWQVTMLAEIMFPDQPGMACDVIPNAIPIGGLTPGLGSFWALPPAVVYPAGMHPLNTITVTDSCANAPLTFGLTDMGDIQSVRWDFGDPASGAADTSTALAPQKTYAQPGTYTIKAEITYPCAVTSLKRTMYIKAPDAPVTDFSYPASPVCQLDLNPAPSPVAGFQTGGIFTAPAGVTVDPATGVVELITSLTGTHTITYSVAAQPLACIAAGSSSATLEILPPDQPVTAFSYASPICILGNNPIPVLSAGLTTGGTFSAAAGLSLDPATGEVNLTASLPGQYVITYHSPASVADCRAEGSHTAPLEILPAVPAVTDFSYPSPVCAHAGSLLPALDRNFSAGGTFSGPVGLGLSPATGMVTPTVSTPGTYTITYAVAPSVAVCHLGGTGSATLTIEPTTYPVTDIAYPTPLCSDAADIAPVPVSGLTPGGTFSSTAGLVLNPVTGEIKVSSSKPGNYLISYTTPEEGCRVAGSSGAPLEIVPTFEPVIDFSYPDPLCAVRPAVNPVLMPGFSHGGTFSGSAGLVVDGVTGSIDLIRTPPGAYTIVYDASLLFCARNARREQPVMLEPVEIPVTDFSYPEILSCEDTFFLPELAPGFSPDGAFSSSSRLEINPITGEIDREASGLGQYTIYYEVEGQGCRIPRGSVAEVGVPDCACRLVLPDAFTPNGDDKNAVFGPVVTCAVADYRCTMYDRWGLVVFETGSLDLPWDGTQADGNPAPEGVYLAKVEGVFPDGREIRMATTVVLIR